MTNRRDFLKVTGALGAGLVLGLRLDAKDGTGQAEFRPNACLAVRPDGTVRISVPKTEMGQGVRTTLPLVVAEELDLDWSRIEVVTAQPGPEFKSMQTGGSTRVDSTLDAPAQGRRRRPGDAEDRRRRPMAHQCGPVSHRKRFRPWAGREEARLWRPRGSRSQAARAQGSAAEAARGLPTVRSSGSPGWMAPPSLLARPSSASMCAALASVSPPC